MRGGGGGRKEGERRKEEGGRRKEEGERRKEEGGGWRKEERRRREKEGGKGTQKGSTTSWKAAPQQGKLVLQRPAGPRESRPQDSHKDSPSSPSVCTREQPGGVEFHVTLKVERNIVNKNIKNVCPMF